MGFVSIAELHEKKNSFKFTEALSNQGNHDCPDKWRKKSSEMMEPAEKEMLHKVNYIVQREIKGFPLFCCLR